MEWLTVWYVLIGIGLCFNILVKCCFCVFQIDCQTEECSLRYIDGSTAESLSVDCGGSGCVGSHIVCPVGVDSNCSVDCSVGSCQSAAISNADGGSMDTLSVICSDCQYLTISLDPIAISVVNIHCGALEAVCVLILNSIHRHKMIKQCVFIQTPQCLHVDLDISTELTDALNLYCDEEWACGFFEFDVVGSGAVNVDCKGMDFGPFLCRSTLSFQIDIAIFGAIHFVLRILELSFRFHRCLQRPVPDLELRPRIF